jgi:hypothetical protein
MAKLDLRKELKPYYSAKKKPEIIDVPSGSFLAIPGRGEPGGEVYRAGMNALYGLSYTLKFALKEQGKDFTVMTLEGLWWWDDPKIVALADAPPRAEWNFKSMIRQPDFVTKEMVDGIRPKVKEKSGAMVDDVVLGEFHEGLSAQIMHIGPYSEEDRSIEALHGFIMENGYKFHGHHHEIYMSDPRRAAPERLKTIIRQPVE